MRNKIKQILLCSIVLAILLVIPSFVNAATTYTYSDTEQGVEWTYELDSSENVVNLKLKTTSKTGSITIPSTIDDKTVISLGETTDSNWSSTQGAFRGCTGITAVTIPNTVTTIGYKAFYGCTGLKEIVIPNSVTSIRSEAFEGCTGITSVTLSNALTNLGSEAFKGCTGIKEITIPDSLAKIGDNSFENCTGLKSITLSKNLSTIGNSSFSGCTGIKEISFPGTLTTIGTSAFSGCSGLTKLTLPDSVTSIGSSAFKSCSGLKDVKLSENLTKIDERVFAECTGLTSIIIPESVTTLTDDGWQYGYCGSFYGCSNLTKILIPDSVASIGAYVFQGCSKLTIYGNDGQTSKTYAEEKGINFDYIANWNKGDAGNDVTAPTVEKINIPYDSVYGYWDKNSSMYIIPSEKVLQIEVIFSEEIVGSTTPTLIVKFGDGENISLTEGSVAGKKIKYLYTIKSTDKGIMKTVSFTGGNIKDVAGNSATLTCPALFVGDISSLNDPIYANGTSSPAPTPSTTPSATPTPKASATPTPSTATEDDTTIKTPKLPQTGEEIGIILGIVAIISIGVIVFIRYKKFEF